jgi:uncharacterized membrane protein
MKETTEYDLPYKIVDLMGIALTIGSAIIAIYNFSSLPNSIPIHFNYWGKPDVWGSKEAIFLLPVIAVFTQVSLALATFVTEKTNPDNIKKTLTLNLLRYLKAEVGLLFLLGTFGSVKSAIENTNFPILALYLPMMLIFGTITWYFILLIKSKNEHENNI